jgi:hypothetical protein
MIAEPVQGVKPKRLHEDSNDQHAVVPRLVSGLRSAAPPCDGGKIGRRARRLVNRTAFSSNDLPQPGAAKGDRAGRSRIRDRW